MAVEVAVSAAVAVALDGQPVAVVAAVDSLAARLAVAVMPGLAVVAAGAAESRSPVF